MDVSDHRVHNLMHAIGHLGVSGRFAVDVNVQEVGHVLARGG